MNRVIIPVLLMLTGATGCAQQGSENPFSPIETDRGVVVVDFEEFTRIPDSDGQAPRLMHMLTEPGTRRLVVSTMTGRLYTLDYRGDNLTEYLDLTEYGVDVLAAGRERGLQSFAFHPQFAEDGAPGYGRFYTYTDVVEAGQADFVSGGDRRSHDTVLLEWTATDAAAARYDGGPPRELFRLAQPFANHNAGEAAFNPLATAGDADYGLLYLGVADGGSGGDPFNVGQNPGNAFGKIWRIDPLGSDGRTGAYGIPADNPLVGDPQALPELYALGLRNPQRFGWDPRTGRMLVADIGQNRVEEISPVTAGANLGWNDWEGSYRFVNGDIAPDDPRSAAGLTWPLVEYDHADPLWIGRVAITGVHVFRGDTLPALRDTIVFADIPSGELLTVPADTTGGGQAAIRRVLLNDGGEARNLLQLIREKNREQGRFFTADRADLRFGRGPGNELFLLNKGDGVIRRLVP